MKQFKRHRDYGFFDQDIRLSKLSQLGDPLERLNKGIDFEIFREILEQHLIKLAKGKGGRRAYDYVLMFKILILQRYYNLSDDQVEYQINDRMSFMRFLNLTIADDVPDSKTVWNFREQLVGLEIVELLFNRFIKELERLNLIINAGKIVDASFIDLQKASNKEKSKTRARVEHVFGFMEMSMNGMYLYVIGIKRIEAIVGLMNLTWNMFRKLQI